MFVKYDIMMVGEVNGVILDSVDEWVVEDGGNFNMIFQFEYMGLWDKGEEKLFDLIELKMILINW